MGFGETGFGEMGHNLTCMFGIDEFAGLEFAGLENDGVEQEQTYIQHTLK